MFLERFLSLNELQLRTFYTRFLRVSSLFIFYSLITFEFKFLFATLYTSRECSFQICPYLCIMFQDKKVMLRWINSGFFVIIRYYHKNGAKIRYFNFYWPGSPDMLIIPDRLLPAKVRIRFTDTSVLSLVLTNELSLRMTKGTAISFHCHSALPKILSRRSSLNLWASVKLSEISKEIKLLSRSQKILFTIYG